jgi:hypothetical protein
VDFAENSQSAGIMEQRNEQVFDPGVLEVCCHAGFLLLSTEILPERYHDEATEGGDCSDAGV